MFSTCVEVRAQERNEVALSILRESFFAWMTFWACTVVDLQVCSPGCYKRQSPCLTINCESCGYDSSYAD